MRFRFLTLALVVVVVQATVPARVRSAEPAKRPNIIFILTDDQRWDALGCMGNKIIRTPNIDKLAAQGTLFINMFCTTSICATSRASFMTGQYERRHKIDNFRTPLTKDQFAKTFPALLRKHGYRTGMVGKWGLGGPLPKDEYDEFKGFSGQGRYYAKGRQGKGEHLTHKVGKQVLEFLDGCSADRPFLLQYYTKAAHCQDGDPWPFQPDRRYNRLFAAVDIPAPQTATEAHFKALPAFLRKSEARRRWYIRFANPELYQKSVKDYYRLVAGVDDVVGKIVAKLHAKNLADNTVIIYTSDNGFYLGEHGLAGKWYMHEESIRLPLVVYDPRLPKAHKGTKRSEMVLSIDIAPTILELAGVKIPVEAQGQSLVPLMNGEKVQWRQDFLYEHRFRHARIPMSEGVRAQRWKYVRYTSVEPVREELYDLKNDRYEERNLAGLKQYAGKLAEMRSRWKAWQKRAE